ncbi:MAG: cell division protein FtsA [Verrucomicrobia bacterium]|nr:cell division protein FtsA [Verrucomicrobiota bacterium]
MFDPSNVIVGLEVGTSKICVVVGEVSGGGAPNLIGVGQCKSRGVRKGEITDVDQVSSDIRDALAEAEEMANVEIRSVWLGVSGGHIGGFNNHGSHQVPSIDREITEEDVEHVMKNAKVANMGADRYPIHVNRHHFTVNGQHGVVNPVGMLGQSLEVDVHITFGNFNRLQNPVRVVKGLPMEVEGIVFNGLASALAVLLPVQKQQGTLVIDMGGGTTDYAVFHEGLVRHTGVLAVGGDHLTNDLAYFFKVPISAAEKLKREHGGVLVGDDVKGRTLTLPSEHGLPEKSVNLEHLRRIMKERVEETFQLIEEELGDRDLMNCVRAGVVICGGSANIPDVLRMAENVFQVPAYKGRTTAMSGTKAALDQPEFATAIGLVRFGAQQGRARKRRAIDDLIPRRVKETIEQLFGRA